MQTILPLKKNLRTGRLCSSYDELIKDLENEALAVQQEAEGCRKRKRELEGELQGVQHRLQSVKVIVECLIGFPCHMLTKQRLMLSCYISIFLPLILHK